jgi:hypothetical protein
VSLSLKSTLAVPLPFLTRCGDGVELGREPVVGVSTVRVGSPARDRHTAGGCFADGGAGWNLDWGHREVEFAEEGVEGLVEVEAAVDIKAQDRGDRSRPAGVGHLVQTREQVAEPVDRVGVGHAYGDDELVGQDDRVDREQPLVRRSIEEHVVEAV